jgi:hypothetical protein
LRDGEGAATRKPAPKRAEKLDGFKDYIVAQLNAAAPDWIGSASGTGMNPRTNCFTRVSPPW